MGIYASPSGLLMVKRDPTLALYPIAIDDFAAGQLLNAQTNVNATMAGGSTLLAAAKRRNDFQRLTSTFPGLAYRASPAWTNLLWALNADAPSMEGDTAGIWTGLVGVTSAINSTDAWHGSRSLQLTATVAVAYARGTLTGAVTPGNQYTLAFMVKAGNVGAVGKQVRPSLYGSVSGFTHGTAVTLTTDWQLVTVTKTFNVADVSLYAYVGGHTAGAFDVGDITLTDACILVAGATVPQFEEKECVATSATFPTPFSAGEPVSFLFFVWTPWAGNDGVLHTIFDSQGTAANQNRILIQKTAANNLEFNIWDNATNLKQCSEAVTAVNWPAGTMKRVTISRDAGVMNAFLNGVVFGTLNAGAGTGLESALGANSYIGTDNAGANQLNGVMMPYMYEGYAWSAEEHGYYSTLQAPPPRTRRIA